MIIKGMIDEDFVNYRHPSMTIMMPRCTFKCGKQACQNSTLANSTDISIDPQNIITRYLQNQITKAIVFSGLDPLDTAEDVVRTIRLLRERDCTDDVVIYTGYTEEEVCEKTIDGIPFLEYAQKHFAPLVIKYGRYVPNQQPHYDEVLGVTLASDNQYARRYE